MHQLNSIRTSFVVTVILSLVICNAQGQALEEIVVTAQKREQSLQDVPLSITAVTGETLTKQGMKSLIEMSDFTSNFTVDETLSASVIVARGIATIGLNPAFEQSTPMFLDGVFMGKSRQAMSQFLDVERVEVLRGPQPTYFGQNAIAGAVNMISQRPGDVWEGYISGAYGNENEANVDLAYGGPINDQLGVRVAGRWYTHDGYQNDTNSNKKAPESENFSGRILLEWTPSDRLNVTAKGEIHRLDIFSIAEQGIGCNVNGPDFCSLVSNDSRFNVEFVRNNSGNTGGIGIAYDADPTVLGDGFGPFAALNGLTLGMAGIVPPGDPAANVLLCPVCGDIKDVSAYDIMSDEARDTEGETGAIYFDYDLGFATLTSQTAYQHFQSKIGFDLDMTAAAGFSASQLDDQDQISQEIRLTSPGGETIDWMAGFYYQDIEFTTSFSWISAWDGGQFVAPTDPVAPYRHVETTSDDTWISGFAALTWNINEVYSIDLGVRYTDVKKDAVNSGYSRLIDVDNNPATADFGPIIPGSEQLINKSFDDDSFDPSITLNWQASEDIKLYGRWAQGFKAGGFAVGVTIPSDDPMTPGVDESDQFVYDSEEAESFEIGMKSQLLEKRLILNIALFTTDYKNLQVSAFDNAAIAFTITNAASATSQGLEIEGQYQATEQLQLNYAFTLLDASYDSFPNAQCNKNEVPSNALTGSCDRTNEDLLYAVPWNLTIGANYNFPMTDTLYMNLSALGAFSDGYQTSEVYLANSRQGSFEKINLRAAISPVDEKWEVAVYGRNITDEQTISNWFDGVANGLEETRLTQARGASYGVQFNYNF